MAKQNSNSIDRHSLQDCGGSSSSEYHSVGLSGGKDSSALLLLILEKGRPIDSVIVGRRIEGDANSELFFRHLSH